ncbi:LysR family transcriptional regulator [Massilia sp. S19_KUP03_FR1]|uniref:LysR family transcriptional regulator n=1 Tax=Massilia sp. S19_KUP03_FR1 TaxID=3025503 RepID=UPI002FCD6DB3
MSLIKKYSLDDLVTYVAVVDTGSFSAASIALASRKPAVSKQIARLELALQTRLLNRTTRHLSMTEVGQEVYRHALRMLEETAELELKVARNLGAPSGLLRISTSTVFGNLHLAGLLAGFQARYPEVMVELHLTDRFVSLADEGYDVVLRMSREMPLMTAIARPLARLHYAVVASPGYVERFGAPETLEQLAGHRCITFNQTGAAATWHFGFQGATTSIKVKNTLSINSSESLRVCMLNGCGIALLPTFAVGPDIKRGHALALLTAYQPVGMFGDYLHALYLENRYLAPKVRVFIDYIIEQIGPRAYWDDF